MLGVFKWFVLVLCFDAFVLIVLSDEPRQNCYLASPPPPPSNFIAAGRPKAAHLFWFFGDFRCVVPLFIVILVIYKYEK